MRGCDSYSRRGPLATSIPKRGRQVKKRRREPCLRWRAAATQKCFHAEFYFNNFDNVRSNEKARSRMQPVLIIHKNFYFWVLGLNGYEDWKKVEACLCNNRNGHYLEMSERIIGITFRGFIQKELPYKLNHRSTQITMKRGHFAKRSLRMRYRFYDYLVSPSSHLSYKPRHHCNCCPRYIWGDKNSKERPF